MRLLRLCLIAALAACVFPAIAPATPFDTFDQSTFNDLDTQGIEIPYVSAGQFARAFDVDTSTFGYDIGEQGGGTDQTGCTLAGGGFAFGARTAWVRFRPGVAGTLRFQAIADRDVLLRVRPAAFRPPLQTTFGDLGPDDCIDTTDPAPILGETLDQIPVVPDKVYHLQALELCGRGPSFAAACPDPAGVAGGPLRLSIRFTPHDQDLDAFPDSRDACPALAGSAEGCPDDDGDGIADTRDECRSLPGDLANGCLSTDLDRDGFRADASTNRDCDDRAPAVNPQAGEIPDNAIDENCDGIVAADRDRDGVLGRPAGADCDDGDSRVRPGAREIAQNGKDDDCAGGDAAFPRVGRSVVVNVAALLFRGTRVGLARMSVAGAPRGMRVDVRCNGLGCPIARRVQKAKGGGRAVRITAFDRPTLARGAIVEVRLERVGYVSRVLRYAIRGAGRKPLVSEWCRRPDSDRVTKRC